MNDAIRILAIERSRRRVAVTLSNLRQPLLVSEEMAQRYRLVEGIVLTLPQFEELKVESELYRCDREVARLLAMRGHSVGEVRGKLRQKEFSKDAVEKTIEKYRRYGVLDDAQYAYQLAQRLLEGRPCGKSYLTAHLQKKMIDRALAEQTADIALSGKDETEQALSALKKRWPQFSQFELEVARRKSYNYLARRGFAYDAAKKAFETLFDRKNEVNED